jgi:phosphate:Na+ symporter
LWIPEFAQIIRSIAENFGSDMARQIANAHTVFNVGLALVFLPFTTLFAAIILKIMPKKEESGGLESFTWHLDEKSLETPALAIGLIKAETTRMANLVEKMLRAIIVPFISDEKWIQKEVPTKDEAKLLIKEIPKRDEIFPQLTLLEGIDMREKKIDFLEEKISDFLVQIAKQELSEMQSEEVYSMMSIVSDMESIGDIIHRNLVPLIEKKQGLGMDFSEEGKEELMIYHEKACRQIRLLKEAFAETDQIKAREIMEGERIFLDLELKYRVQHLERILHRRKESVETHEVHMEILDILKQIIVYTSNIAKTYLATFAGNEYK